MRGARLTDGVSHLVAIAAACTSFESTGDGAGADGPSNDAPGPPLDAGDRDGGDGRDAHAWVPCALRDADLAHFCADFDQSDDVSFGWTNELDMLGGTFGPTDAAASPPRAAVAQLPAATTTTGFGAAVLVRGS